MSENQSYKTIIALMNDSQEVEVKEVRQGGNFKCPVYLRESDKTTGIDILDLSVRSYNCLKRAGFNTMEDLITKVHGKEDLLRIRNCGHKSVKEILEKMFLYQLMAFPKDKRMWYINETIMKCLQQ